MWIFEEQSKGYGERGLTRILRMPEGAFVLRAASEAMIDRAHDIKEKLRWSNEDIDLLIPHQANIRVTNKVERKTGLTGKVFSNIHKYGNMSAASCAVAMAEAKEEDRIKEGSKVIVASIGSGLVSTGVGIQF